MCVLHTDQSLYTDRSPLLHLSTDTMTMTTGRLTSCWIVALKFISKLSCALLKRLPKECMIASGGSSSTLRRCVLMGCRLLCHVQVLPFVIVLPSNPLHHQQPGKHHSSSCLRDPRESRARVDGHAGLSSEILASLSTQDHHFVRTSKNCVSRNDGRIFLEIDGLAENSRSLTKQCLDF